nr:MAG: acetyl-CoA carboxylase biotin carboxyl carrier protein subunit [Bacillota bacterium]
MTRRFRVTIGGVTYTVEVEELTSAAPAHAAAAGPAVGPVPAPAAGAPGASFISPAAAPVSGNGLGAAAAPGFGGPAVAAGPASAGPAPAAASAAVSAAATASAPAAAPAGPAAAGGEAPAEGRAVCAPLPGIIVSVPVQVGQQVREGDVVAVLEAMKMENDITSPYAGTVKQVLVSRGDSVAMNDPLVVIG